MNKKHSPLPWEVHVGEDYIVVLRTQDTTDTGIRVDNLKDAEFIVRACNNHDKLVEALKKTTEVLNQLLTGQQDDNDCAFAVIGRVASENGRILYDIAEAPK